MCADRASRSAWIPKEKTKLQPPGPESHEQHEVERHEELDHRPGERQRAPLEVAQRLELRVGEVRLPAALDHLLIATHRRVHRVPPRLVRCVLLRALAHRRTQRPVADEALEEDAVRLRTRLERRRARRHRRSALLHAQDGRGETRFQRARGGERHSALRRAQRRGRRALAKRAETLRLARRRRACRRPRRRRRRRRARRARSVCEDALHVQQQARDAVTHEVRRALGVQADDRQARRKRLEHHLAERLCERGECKDAAAREHGRQAFAFLVAHERGVQAVFCTEARQLRPRGAVADDDQLRIVAHARREQAERLDQETDVLFPADPADVEHHGLAVGVLGRGARICARHHRRRQRKVRRKRREVTQALVRGGRAEVRRLHREALGGVDKRLGLVQLAARCLVVQRVEERLALGLAPPARAQVLVACTRRKGVGVHATAPDLHVLKALLEKHTPCRLTRAKDNVALVVLRADELPHSALNNWHTKQRCIGWQVRVVRRDTRDVRQDLLYNPHHLDTEPNRVHKVHDIWAELLEAPHKAQAHKVELQTGIHDEREAKRADHGVARVLRQSRVRAEHHRLVAFSMQVLKKPRERTRDTINLGEEVFCVSLGSVPVTIATRSFFRLRSIGYGYETAWRVASSSGDFMVTTQHNKRGAEGIEDSAGRSTPCCRHNWERARIKSAVATARGGGHVLGASDVHSAFST